MLPESRAAEVLGWVLGVANSVAVADHLRLSESESIPKALEKAVRGIDRGLRELSTEQRQPRDVLDATPPLHLFRVGATLDPEIGPPPAPPRRDEDD